MVDNLEENLDISVLQNQNKTRLSYQTKLVALIDYCLRKNLKIWNDVLKNHKHDLNYKKKLSEFEIDYYITSYFQKFSFKSVMKKFSSLRFVEKQFFDGIFCMLTEAISINCSVNSMILPDIGHGRRKKVLNFLF